MKARKSKLDEVAGDLEVWFRDERLTLAQAQERLRERGVAVSGQRLSVWWARKQEESTREAVLARVVSGRQMSTELDAQFKKHPAPEMDTIQKLLRVLVMKLAVHGELDHELLPLVQGLLKSVTDAQRVDQSERALALNQQKFDLVKRRADQADAAQRLVEDGSLSEEMRAARIREIFGTA